MLRRLTFIIALLAIPTAVWAADVSDLGPVPTNPAISNSSTPTNTYLQPANPTALQNSDNSAATLVSPSTSGNLQPAGAQDQVAQFMAGEGDGSGPQSATTLGGTQTNDWAIIGVFLLMAALYVAYNVLHTRFLRRRYNAV